MPIKISRTHPAYKILDDRGVFVMDLHRAETQDIRPLRIGLLNLMPNKEDTEIQIFSAIGDTPLQVEPVLIRTATYTPKHVSKSHLEEFYVTFDEVKNQGLDGLIVTGAPVELLQFEDVAYWEELTQIMDWAREHITSTLYLCWSAQAFLYRFYKIPKIKLPEKCIGVFRHQVLLDDPLTRDLDDEYWVPHGRNTEVSFDDIKTVDDIEVLVESKEAGLHLMATKDRKTIFQFGHPEYLPNTLRKEYLRDKATSNFMLNPPRNYFIDDDEANNPHVRWRANAAIFYRNWINHVYQTTPYDLKTHRRILL